jgi:hypothetical protein
MRFAPDGPRIPNELLELRDAGEVVFFCGAGISIPAGLPSFYELTKRVVGRLGWSSTSALGKSLNLAFAEDDASLAPPLDQVFEILQREYTASRVQQQIEALLKAPRQADLSRHEIVLKLSTNRAGKPFVVTTNFDDLFERARKGLAAWGPPTFPAIDPDTPPTGLIYLHGRMGSRIGESISLRTLVLSSGDFGRAYLADGWATAFVRQLLERHVIVFLGYSATDPPIRYLLQGLSSSTSLKPKGLFAFDRGEPEEVVARWNGLGVEVILSCCRFNGQAVRLT